MSKLYLTKGTPVTVKNNGRAGTIGIENFLLTHTPYYFNGKFIGVLTTNPVLRSYTAQQRSNMASTIRELRRTKGKYMAPCGPKNIMDTIEAINDPETHLQTDYSILGVFPEHPDYWLFNGILTAPNGRKTQFLYRIYSPVLVNLIKQTVKKRYSDIAEFNEYLASFPKSQTTYHVYP